MKRIFFPVIILCSAFALFAQPKSGPIMTFETTEIDYGTITKGADPLRVFKFTNTGTEPLSIYDAHGSCGCTIPSFKKEPIQPGETSEIEVRYDTERLDYFEKTITISNNEHGVKYRLLTIKGTVVKPDAEAPTGITTPGTQAPSGNDSGSMPEH